MQVNFKGVYQLSLPESYGYKKQDRQKRAFLDTLNNKESKKAYYTKKEEDEIKSFFLRADREYIVPKAAKEPNNEGACTFHYKGDEYLLTGNDKKTYKTIRTMFHGKKVNLKKLSEFKNALLEDAKDKNNYGSLALDSTNGKKLDIISLSRPYKPNRDDMINGNYPAYYNAGIII